MLKGQAIQLLIGDMRLSRQRDGLQFDRDRSAALSAGLLGERLWQTGARSFASRRLVMRVVWNPKSWPAGLLLEGTLHIPSEHNNSNRFPAFI